jgi:hypothetical protein
VLVLARVLALELAVLARSRALVSAWADLVRRYGYGGFLASVLAPLVLELVSVVPHRPKELVLWQGPSLSRQ